MTPGNVCGWISVSDAPPKAKTAWSEFLDDRFWKETKCLIGEEN
jgi:hypothetical protein